MGKCRLIWLSIRNEGKVLEKELKIEYLATEKLIPYLNNARTHSEKQIAQIAASIREFGFNNPILVDRLNTVICGHGRLAAANKLEMQTVPVLRAEHMSKAQQKAYVLADNQLALNAGWDQDLLKLELGELKDLDFDLDLLGFDNLDSLVGAVIDESGAPALPDGDKPSFQQMAFVLHDDQVELIKESLDFSKGMGSFPDINANSNGNAIHRICEQWLQQRT